MSARMLSVAAPLRALSSSLGPWRILPAALLQPISLQIPSLADIWDSVLRAVPKKKTSHMKKRHRQMAGKALKDVKSLNTCPGCGSIKRAHLLCPHCVKGMHVLAKRADRYQY